VQRNLEIDLDEDILTVKDYSLEVKNPPNDARDPDEWKQFFLPYASEGIRSCTITFDNAKMTEALVQRRVLLGTLEHMLSPDTNMNDKKKLFAQIQSQKDELDANTPLLRRLFRKSDYDSAVSLYETIFVGNDCIEKQIKHLAKQPKTSNVSKVFVVFETERGKRNALEKISQEGANFRGHFLKVQEPCEPSAVRWHNLEESTMIQVTQQVLALLVVVAFVAFGAFVIYLVKHKFREWASGPAVVVMVLNTIVPKICHYLNSFESHASEGAYQASLYIKLTLAYWVNTAIAQLIISNFSSYIASSVLPVNENFNDGGNEEVVPAENLLPNIYALFLWDMVYTPLISFLDLGGMYAKYFKARGAKTQKEMNLNFQGTSFSLAERYTNMTRMFFLCSVYGTIFPASYFFCALSLLITYMVDKYMLLRRWVRSPRLGSQIAAFGREYYSVAVVGHAVMTAYWWSGFSYDNVCGNENYGYYYCSQDFLGSRMFPPLPKNQETLNANIASDGSLYHLYSIGTWMSEGQEILTQLCGWTSTILLGVFVFYKFFKYIFYLTFPLEDSTEDQYVDFSALQRLGQEIFLYVPQRRVPGFTFPLLMCNIDDIDKNRVGWKDPFRGYDYHNVVFDIDEINPLNRKRDEKINTDEWDSKENGQYKLESANPVFSIVKEWKG